MQHNAYVHDYEAFRAVWANQFGSDLIGKDVNEDGNARPVWFLKQPSAQILSEVEPDEYLPEQSHVEQHHGQNG